MSNPFDDNGDDETAREIQAEIERMEREKLERERLEAEQAQPGVAEFDGEVPFVEEEAELRLSNEDERLPWLESDDDYADDVVDTARIATVALLGLLAIVALAAIVWWLNRDQPDTELLADGSTIEAPAEPFRARPDSPGGVAAEGTGDVSYEVGEGQDRETQMGAATTAPAPTPSSSATPGASASAAARPSIDRSQSAAAPAPAASAGGVGVQVGAYSSRATAETGWAQLTNQHSALSGVNHRIVQATVDGNTVFRLQAVAGTTAAAETLCRAIKSGGGDCRVAN